MPKRALAVDAAGAWVLLLARHRGRCRDCGRPVAVGQKVVWNRDTRGTWCTRCCSVSLLPTEYGLARKRNHVAYGRRETSPRRTEDFPGT